MQSVRFITAGVAHAVHGILLAFPIALFTSALLSDIAYLRTAEIQWTNFSQWLIAGALVFSGLVLVWALIRLLPDLRRPLRRQPFIYPGLLALMCVLGLINAMKHSQDAWSSVGVFGLVLSILCTLLALAAGVIFHITPAREVAR